MSAGLIGPAEVADRLGVSVKAVRGLIERGELPAYRVANRLRVNPADLIDFLAARQVTPRPGPPPPPAPTPRRTGERASARDLLLGD